MVRTHRHPIRGILGGLCLGLGLAILSVVYGINVAGAITPWVALIVGLLIGILLIYMPSIRKGRRQPPATYVAPGYPPR
jgi:threonine/homoserine/homoserine lactone efflux protein